MRSNTPAYMLTDWFRGLTREVEASSQTAVAKKMGIPRVSLTILLRGLGAYGTGRCSTARYERLYRQTFEAITCPFNGRPVDIEYCREKALQAAPTHNPQKLNHWKACQECQFKPAAPKAPSKRRGRVEIPLAALDTKTLPLPVVGGPQIDLTIKERSE